MLPHSPFRPVVVALALALVHSGARAHERRLRAWRAGKVLTDEEIERWEGVFDEDCSMQNFWHKCAGPSVQSFLLPPAADDRHAGRAQTGTARRPTTTRC